MENLDRYLFEWINTGMSNSFFDQWMPYFTDLHKQPGFLKVTLPVLLVTWIIQSRWEVLKVLLAVSLCVTLADSFTYRVLKPTFQRERPAVAEKNANVRTDRYAGYSFPSNHAANNFAGAAVLSYFYPPFSFLFYAFAALVAFSRVYVGVHYPFDVLGGAVVGYLIAITLIYLGRRLPIIKEYLVKPRKR